MMTGNVTIRRLATGVSGLDNLLGGGVPEFSFNIISGTPGSGKTTLAYQMMFAMAQPESKAIFFTVMGEPALKMLRYQQQFSFFDMHKIGKSIRFINLADDLVKSDYTDVMKRINREVKEFSPRYVFVDSFRSIVFSSDKTDCCDMDLWQFVHELGQQMTGWQATTFLVGEHFSSDVLFTPVLAVADGILLLSQNLQGNSMVRKIQVIKMRGQTHTPGLSTFRIDEGGLTIFPRAILPADGYGQLETESIVDKKRVSMGVRGLDDMMGGGLPVGYALLLAGSSGSGKTVMATEFLAEGVRQGEPGVIAAFEKSPRQLLSRKLHDLLLGGRVAVLSSRNLDLSIDETLYDLIALIKKMHAQRVVIDSLSAFELALAPEFRENFRESLYRMISVLTAMGVTIVMTSEIEDRYSDLRFSSYGNAFLADAIVLQRYVQIGGKFERAISVIKVRGSAHSKDIRLFEIVRDEILIGDSLSQYEGILSGIPVFRRMARVED